MYAELPLEAAGRVKSQYQHVDLLPRLPDNVYEGEDKRHVVDVLNQTDPVRRVVRNFLTPFFCHRLSFFADVLKRLPQCLLTWTIPCAPFFSTTGEWQKRSRQR
jgi:hypothetical protein